MPIAAAGAKKVQKLNVQNEPSETESLSPILHNEQPIIIVSRNPKKSITELKKPYINTLFAFMLSSFFELTFISHHKDNEPTFNKTRQKKIFF